MEGDEKAIPWKLWVTLHKGVLKEKNNAFFKRVHPKLFLFKESKLHSGLQSPRKRGGGIIHIEII